MVALMMFLALWRQQCHSSLYYSCLMCLIGYFNLKNNQTMVKTAQMLLLVVVKKIWYQVVIVFFSFLSNALAAVFLPYKFEQKALLHKESTLNL